MPTSTSDPRALAREAALAQGFDAIGFARPGTVAEAAKHLTEFLAQGWHGDMDWLAAKAERRRDPAALWPDVKSVMVLGLNYGPADDPRAILAHGERGAISVYAQGGDYHDVVKRKLKAVARTLVEACGGAVKVFVDTAPVLEKPLAHQAGLGWQGKHTNLVSTTHGSWLFLGAIFTTLDLGDDAALDDHCGTCRACLDACPTAAFPAPYKLDARRCISYLTIEHRGHIPTEFRAPMGNRIYGCDDCLAACPWNKFAHSAREAAFQPRAELRAPRLHDLAALDDAAFRQVFAGSPIKRVGRDRFVRNVLIALGNSNTTDTEGVVRHLDDASPLVRAMAVWALGRLDPARAAQEGGVRAAGEPDADVRAEWCALSAP
jgi:epoxyqueuosine reductase